MDSLELAQQYLDASGNNPLRWLEGLLAGGWGPISALHSLIETGGNVLWAILLVCFLLWLLIFERYWFYRRVYPQQMAAWVAEWDGRSDKVSWFAHRIREGMISEARVSLTRNVAVIQVLVAMCPLFGLLGTVTGMISVFDVMALGGSGEVRALASGVSRATVPTMAGMVVALSGLYFSTRMNKNIAREVDRLADRLRFH
jgi:biopolymer transport protein ExbB